MSSDSMEPDAVEMLSREIDGRLRPGGPEVDYAALYSYLDGDLPAEAQRAVERCIATWVPWHRAYWETRALMTGYDLTSPPGGEPCPTESAAAADNYDP